MHYTLAMLRDDLAQVGRLTTGWRDYTPSPLWPQLPLGDDYSLALDPNTPEAAAFDYFVAHYGPQDGPDLAARFFAIHHFVTSNVEKLARRGFLQATPHGPSPAEDLILFLLTCFQDPTPPERHPRSIYDPSGGLALPYEDILADFHRLRALRARFAPREQPQP